MLPYKVANYSISADPFDFTFDIRNDILDGVIARLRLDIDIIISDKILETDLVFRPYALSSNIDTIKISSYTTGHKSEWRYRPESYILSYISNNSIDSIMPNAVDKCSDYTSDEVFKLRKWPIKIEYIPIEYDNNGEMVYYTKVSAYVYEDIYIPANTSVDNPTSLIIYFHHANKENIRPIISIKDKPKYTNGVEYKYKFHGMRLIILEKNIHPSLSRPITLLCNTHHIWQDKSYSSYFDVDILNIDSTDEFIYIIYQCECEKLCQ